MDGERKSYPEALEAYGNKFILGIERVAYVGKTSLATKFYLHPNYNVCDLGGETMLNPDGNPAVAGCLLRAVRPDLLPLEIHKLSASAHKPGHVFQRAVVVQRKTNRNLRLYHGIPVVFLVPGFDQRN